MAAITSERHVTKEIRNGLAVVCSSNCLGQNHRYVNDLQWRHSVRQGSVNSRQIISVFVRSFKLTTWPIHNYPVNTTSHYVKTLVLFIFGSGLQFTEGQMSCNPISYYFILQIHIEDNPDPLNLRISYDMPRGHAIWKIENTTWKSRTANGNNICVMIL